MPTWEPINQALQRIAAAGLSKKQAQRDLCLAMADGKIAVRVHLAADHSRGLPPKALSSPVLEIPPRLSPVDFDWPHSRPSKHSQLWTGPSQRAGESPLLYFHENHDRIGRTVDLVEVSVADVTKVFCNTESRPMANPTAGSLKPRPNIGAKAAGIAQADKALWPDGRPAGLSPKDRDRQIAEWLEAKNLSIPTRRTIQRVLKQLDC
jgi:hypothetical protein